MCIVYAYLNKKGNMQIQYYHGAISNVHPNKKQVLDRLAKSIIPADCSFKSGWLDDTSAWKCKPELGHENYRYTFKVVGIGANFNEKRAQAIARQWATVYSDVLVDEGISFVSCQQHKTVSRKGKVYYKVDVRFNSLKSIVR